MESFMFPEGYQLSLSHPWYDCDRYAVYRRRLLYQLMRTFLAWRLVSFGFVCEGDTDDDDDGDENFEPVD